MTDPPRRGDVTYHNIGASVRADGKPDKKYLLDFTRMVVEEIEDEPTPAWVKATVLATAKRAIACPVRGGLLCDKAECLANGCKGRP